MSNLAVGVNLPNFFVVKKFTPGEILDFAARAEELGFDLLVVGDHLVWNTPVLDPIVTLSVVSSTTQKIGLVIGVYLLALRHPVPVAKSLATLAYFAPERLIFGVGVGGENPIEWEACGVPTDSRGARTDEAIGVIHGLLQGEPTHHDGKFYSFPAIVMTPRPPTPVPIWIGGRSEAAIRRAALFGDGWFPHNLTPASYQAGIARLEEIRGGSGPSTRPVARAFSLPVLVDSDVVRARALADRHFRRLYNVGIERFERYCALGSPEECRRKIDEYLAAGVNQLVLQTLGPDSFGQLEVLARDVLPGLINRRAER